MSAEIHALVIPKYGMVMTEGQISAWHVNEGATVEKGDELVDIETEKVANIYESQYSGVLRRKLVAEGESAPVGSLFGVIAAAHIQEAEIDAFVEEFRASFTSSEAVSGGPTAEVIETEAGYIRYLKQGDGSERPILLVHGFGGDVNSWLLNQGALAESYTTYALDLPGHGGSQKTPDISTIRDMAVAVEGFLDAISLSSVHLVGHSLGGGVASQIAIDRPLQVASLTLLAPTGLGIEINAEFIQGLLQAERRKDMQKVLAMLFHDPALVSRDMIMNVLQGKRIDGAVACLRAIAERCFGGGNQAICVREELLKLSLPMQIIWGLSDIIVPYTHAGNLPETMDVHLIKDAGHMVHMEKAADVNRLIGRFVAASDVRARRDNVNDSARNP